MRTPFRLVIAAAVALVSTFGVARDDHHGLDGAYKRLCAAIKSKNLKATHAMLAPGFTWVETSGRTLNRAQFIAMDTARTKIAELKYDVVDMKNDSYDFMGNEARVRSTTTIVVHGKDKGKKFVARSVSESVDTWRRDSKGRWLVYKVETTGEYFGSID